MLSIFFLLFAVFPLFRVSFLDSRNYWSLRYDVCVAVVTALSGDFTLFTRFLSLRALVGLVFGLPGFVFDGFFEGVFFWGAVVDFLGLVKGLERVVDVGLAIDFRGLVGFLWF